MRRLRTVGVARQDGMCELGDRSKGPERRIRSRPAPADESGAAPRTRCLRRRTAQATTRRWCTVCRRVCPRARRSPRRSRLWSAPARRGRPAPSPRDPASSRTITRSGSPTTTCTSKSSGIGRARVRFGKRPLGGAQERGVAHAKHAVARRDRLGDIDLDAAAGGHGVTAGRVLRELASNLSETAGRRPELDRVGGLERGVESDGDAAVANVDHPPDGNTSVVRPTVAHHVVAALAHEVRLGESARERLREHRALAFPHLKARLGPPPRDRVRLGRPRSPARRTRDSSSGPRS